MKIVIDIDENLYDTIMEDIMPTYDELIPLVTRVYEGTPLPEHGRLIDADKLRFVCNFGDVCYGSPCNKCSYYVISKSEIDNAPTVIEGGKE